MSDGKLGKRYVHVINGEPGPIMTERPGDIVDSRRQATIEVDLDAGRPIDRPEYEHAERTWITAYAECQRLRPDKRSDDVLAAELARLRQQVAAMEKVVTTVAEYTDRFRSNDRSTRHRISADNVVVDGERLRHLLAAVDAYRAGQPTTPAAGETMVVTAQDPNDPRRAYTQHAATSPATLTPAQWAALFELRRLLVEADWDLAFSNVSDDRRRDVITAIDRLRETAYANRNGLDDGDVRRLREAAREWLSTPWPPGSVERHPIERNLTNTLRSLLDSGKLGGGQ